MMRVREAATRDHGRIDALVLDAFGEHRPVVVRLVHALRSLDPQRPGLELVAEDGGELVGHAMWSAARLDAPSGLVDVQVLSPLSVAPLHQRTGVGRTLIAAGAERLAARRVPAVLLEGDPAYYSRLGFSPAVGLGILRPSVRIPEAGFQVMRLPAYEPWMTGTLVYPDAFWALDLVGLR